MVSTSTHMMNNICWELQKSMIMDVVTRSEWNALKEKSQAWSDMDVLEHVYLTTKHSKRCQVVKELCQSRSFGKTV